ncbi:MAG: hypothetical protein Q9186_007670 [Xanthomendoza sp. 1 TL-2023]
MVGTVASGRSAKSSPAKSSPAKKTPNKVGAKRKVQEDIDSEVEDVKDSPLKKAKTSTAVIPNWATVDVRGVKDESVQDDGMDGSFEASFTMPGEI